MSTYRHSPTGGLDYESDHLFLLMGGNPLPNAVAALTLLRPGGMAHIIHTDQTQVQAQNLGRLLAGEAGFHTAPLINLGTAQAAAAVIRGQVQQRAVGLQGQVGMNYTGGTKPMAVHAYRALAAVCPGAIFSYLDSNTAKITLDCDHGPSQRIPLVVDLSLAQMFQLHGLRWHPDHPPLTEPLLPMAATALAEVYQDWHLVGNWRQWCRTTLLPALKQGPDWKPLWQLQDLPPLGLADLAAPLRQLLQTHLGARATELDLSALLPLGFSDLTQVGNWLDGVWLEHYTLDQVGQLAQAYRIREVGLGFQMVDSAGPPGRYGRFEFDLAFCQGHQLFALSCTTATSRSGCKQKLLEAVVRARQLGGSEARVGLVCGYPWSENLRRELEVMGRDRRVAVFGRQEWPQLAENIAKWIETNG
ncbi:MAG: hypothetical protein VKL98_02870 [Cyanobacteriota bacterium]|nr:hypothetical protein [Cyanobacteriota bacterium]